MKEYKMTPLGLIEQFLYLILFFKPIDTPAKVPPVPTT